MFLEMEQKRVSSGHVWLSGSEGHCLSEIAKGRKTRNEFGIQI